MILNDNIHENVTIQVRVARGKPSFELRLIGAGKSLVGSA